MTSPLDLCLAELQKPYYRCKRAPFAAFARRARTRDVSQLVSEGFATLKRHQDEGFNGLGLAYLADLAAAHPARQLAPSIRSMFAFASKPSQDYEVQQVAGRVALALARVGTRADAALLARVLKRLRDDEGERAFMEIFYACCVLERTGARAIAWLEDRAHTRGLSYAVSALADLRQQRAAPVIEGAMGQLIDPTARVAFREALKRLRSRARPPRPMIDLFGQRTELELALGHEDDNVFRRRARRQHGDEVDDSASDEREPL